MVEHCTFADLHTQDRDRGFPCPEMRRERKGIPGERSGVGIVVQRQRSRGRSSRGKRVQSGEPTASYCPRAVELPSPHRGTPVTSFTRLPWSSGGPSTRNPYFPRALRCLLPSTGRIFMLTSFQEKSLRANDEAIYYSAVYQFLIMWFSFNSSHLMQKEKGF